jgi:hypothetical protein
VLLVVFGAGASYDSFQLFPGPPPCDNGPLTPKEICWEERPPLANQLFDSRPIFVDLMEKFKEVQALVPLLRQPGISIEKQLAEFQEQARTYPPAQRELNAIRFYLRSALWDCQDRWRSRHRGVTNFATLLREIDRWRLTVSEPVCFVTFNYDTMLEEAMAPVLRFNVRDMNSYIALSEYKLFKLHGSINWGRELKGIAHPGNATPFAYENLLDIVGPDSPYLTNRYRICNRVMSPAPDRVVVFPAISIPVENKDEFSCPPDHVTALEGLLPHVTKMITIGWRATEDKFLKMLLDSMEVTVEGIRNPILLLVVTGSKTGAEQTVANLAAYGVNQDIFQDPDRVRVTNGFTGLINNPNTLRDFLRAGSY